MTLPEVIGAICSPEEFAENLKLDFSSMIRKKGSIDYLPWAEIVRTLHQKLTFCTYGFKEDENGSMIHYTPTGDAYFRPYITRTIFTDAKFKEGLIFVSPPGFFPVSDMGARHKAITNPNIRQIDNCCRRAIAKEIGLQTGIGLQLWADNDPFDEVEDSAADFSASKPARISVRGLASVEPEPAKVEKIAADALDKAASAAGLEEHGKKTIAMAVKSDSWELIPDEKKPKIISLLSSLDKVKLFNSGRNSTGALINPKSKDQEISEIVQAFGVVQPSSGGGTSQK